MQSRLLATSLIQRQLNWVAVGVGHRWLATFPTGRAADPAVHSGDPEGEDADQAALGAGATEPAPTMKDDRDPMAPPKRPQSTPKLENTGVNRAASDAHQKVQKRGVSSAKESMLEEISCVGVDGCAEEEGGGGREGEETDKEYFSHHKPSALSEIEMADTRKPITKATDADDDRGGNDVVGWLPEQMDTAEEAMARASEIWWKNKITGDPDSPQSRVLRELRGESS